jgi:hypothetical protein
MIIKQLAKTLVLLMQEEKLITYLILGSESEPLW